MARKVYIDHKTTVELCDMLSRLLLQSDIHVRAIYPVPRGGLYPALLLSQIMCVPIVTELPTDPDPTILVVDDIYDTGATRQRFLGYPFAAMTWKDRGRAVANHNHAGVSLGARNYVLGSGRYEEDTWVDFWWESMNNDTGPEHNIVRLLEYIGEDPHREGLLETPKRVVRSYDKLFEGYTTDVEDLFKTFEEKASGGMVYLKDVEFYSTCEHHMLPFVGKATIAYIPDGKVIGVSKLARILEVYARRLQVQERIAEQVTDALMEHLKPKGAACILEARHLCMAARGVEKQHSVMGYSSLKGVFLEDSFKGSAARAELTALCGK